MASKFHNSLALCSDLEVLIGENVPAEKLSIRQNYKLVEKATVNLF